jgi:pseudaminic acid cytidylyltransferase
MSYTTRITRWAIIPARGGSRRIPHKNKRAFFGRPIIEYSIEAAKQSQLFDRIVISSDDEDILKIATDNGCVASRRQAWACEDGIGTQEVARHVLEQEDAHTGRPSAACLIYATCPLMSVQDLHRGWSALRAEGEFAMSVSVDPLADAGQFYWGWRDAFLDGKPLIAEHTTMVPIHWSRVCDINTEEDWARAERMYKALQPVGVKL